MKKYLLEPADQRVVVLPEEMREKKTAMGIILPTDAQENKPGMGKIVEVGAGSKDHPMMWSVGQFVLYSDYAGLEVKLNLEWGDEVYKVMNQADIIGLLTLISS